MDNCRVLGEVARDSGKAAISCTAAPRGLPPGRHHDHSRAVEQREEIVAAPDPTDPAAVMKILPPFATNMAGIFTTMCADPHPRHARVFVSNLYEVPKIDELIPGASLIVQLLNDVLATVAPPFNATIVDIHGPSKGGGA